MKRPAEMLLWVVATMVLSGVTAWFVSGAGENARSEEAGHDHDLHRWMHERLVLTDAQHSALEPFEHAYEETRKRLGAQIVAAGQELAVAVREGNRGAPEVDQALGKLNEAQAELQRATLDHFFAMKEHLDPEQAEKLLEWTHDSIVHE